MATTITGLRRQIASARDLKSVVRTMKASAASAIGQYERSVAALADYARTVERGLSVSLRALAPQGPELHIGQARHENERLVQALIFGSDQGLVGRFNEAVVDHALAALALAKTTTSARIWTVGERAHARLVDAGRVPAGAFPVPASAALITELVTQILQSVPLPDGTTAVPSQQQRLMLFYNRPEGASYAPVSQQLLPLDEHWQRELASRPWPKAGDRDGAEQRFSPLPEVLGSAPQALGAFIREHLFVSLFRASAESLASENASRLAAMQRADRNIGELLQDLQARFHQLRQAGIDEELFDVIAGFDALLPNTTTRTAP
ncbi:MAG: F0F1 ATP synthase subunit gamma [Gammaproteobacteria bacterium]|nr:F0F1 ATP synthase subunit gamma [Gammaproteobacteria bacterium]